MKTIAEIVAEWDAATLRDKDVLVANAIDPEKSWPVPIYGVFEKGHYIDFRTTKQWNLPVPLRHLHSQN